jgi:uncharacterized membrane protein
MNVLSIAILLLATAVFLGMLSIPLMKGRIPPNWWYGMRTSATVHDSSLWYPANRFAGRQLLLAAGLQAVAAVLLIVLRHRLEGGSAGVIALMVLGLTLLVMVVRSHMHLVRLKQSRNGG